MMLRKVKVCTLDQLLLERLGASRYPSSEDPLGQAAYTAAALRGLAEAVTALAPNRLNEPEKKAPQAPM